MAGPSVTVPIFAGGRLNSMLEPRKSQQQEGAIGYQKTLMQAVVNALVAYRLEQQRLMQLKRPIELPAGRSLSCAGATATVSVTFRRCSMRADAFAGGAAIRNQRH